MRPSASMRFPGHGSLWQGHEGSGRGLQRPAHRPRLPACLVVTLRHLRPLSTQEGQVTVDLGEDVEAGPENPPQTVNPLERSRGPNRRARVPAEPLPVVHGDPLDEPGHHRAVTRVEVDHLRVDPCRRRDPRVVLLGTAVYVVRGTFPGEPQRVSRAAYRHLVTGVGKGAAEVFDLDAIPLDVPEKRHAGKRGIHSVQPYSSPYLLWAGATNARDAVGRL
jgi:hypothetical protein